MILDFHRPGLLASDERAHCILQGAYHLTGGAFQVYHVKSADLNPRPLYPEQVAEGVVNGDKDTREALPLLRILHTAIELRGGAYQAIRPSASWGYLAYVRPVDRIHFVPIVALAFDVIESIDPALPPEKRNYAAISLAGAFNWLQVSRSLLGVEPRSLSLP